MPSSYRISAATVVIGLVIEAMLKMQSVVSGSDRLVAVAVSVEQDQLAPAHDRHNGARQLPARDLPIKHSRNARQPLGAEACLLGSRARQRQNRRACPTETDRTVLMRHACGQPRANAMEHSAS